MTDPSARRGRTCADGQVSWDEFWGVIGEWMDTGFNRLEELRRQEAKLKEERDRLAAEEEAKRKAAEEAAAAAAAAAEEERRRKEEQLAALAAMNEVCGMGRTRQAVEECPE